MIKMFSAFTGVGSPEMALRNLNIDFEMVGISEVDRYALLSYDAIHNDQSISIKDIDKEAMLKEFNDKNIAYNFSTYKSEIPRGLEDIKKLYIAHKRSKNYGDITKIDETKLPDFDLFSYSFPCFTAGTLITTFKGLKKIEDVTEQDYVLTHTNSFKKVVATMQTKTNHIIKVSMMSNADIKVTKEHPFYVRKLYKKYPTKKGKRQNIRLFKDPEWVYAQNLDKSYYTGLAINTIEELPVWGGVSSNKWGHNNKVNKLSSYFNIPDFWWFIGRYIGDGWTQNFPEKDKYRTLLCGALKEKDEIEEKLNNLQFSFNRVQENSIYKYHLPWKELSLFLDQFGKYAYGKKLNNTILNLPVSLLKSFLEGYVSADGSQVGKYTTINTVSKELAYNIGQCVMKVYKRPYSLYKSKRSSTSTIEGRTINQRDIYTVRWKVSTDKQDKAFYEKGYIWSPIKKISYQSFNDTVYNIEVEEDNSYVAYNSIVHNCKDISVAGKQKGFEEGSNTQSSLLWECERIIACKKPSYLLMENVKNLIGENHMSGFQEWINVLDQLGYNSYWKLMNGKDYGVPQNRERVIMISILKEKDKGNFFMPSATDKTKILTDILEDKVEDKYFLDPKRYNHIKQLPNQEVSYCIDASYYKGASVDIFINKKRRQLIQVGNADHKEHATTRTYSDEGLAPSLTAMQGGDRQPKIAQAGRIVGRNPTNPKSRERGIPTEQMLEINENPNISNCLTTVGKDTVVNVPVGVASRKRESKGGQQLEFRSESISNSLTTVQSDSMVYADFKVRRLTPLECWRLMGFTDTDFNKAKEVLSNTKLYERAGRGIVVPMLEAVFEKLFIPKSTSLFQQELK